MTLDEVLSQFKSFKRRLFFQSFFDLNNKNFDDYTNFSKSERDLLKTHVKFNVFKDTKVFVSKKGDTFKALLTTYDDLKIETVLMENSRGAYTICVSSQVGCAMGCTFCATGTMGLKRNLTYLEIIGQLKFWQQYLIDNSNKKQILNVVFMGMGEPLANYINVREALNIWIDLKLLGPTRITVSTVGVVPALNRILEDDKWPNVRIAISLHSANFEKRKEIVPTTIPQFHQKLIDWSYKYFKKFSSNRLRVTFEYTLIAGVNDSKAHAKELAEYVSQFGRAKINVIPLNLVKDKDFEPSDVKRIEDFKKVILSYSIDVTQRKTMGEDINAACGQLALSN